MVTSCDVTEKTLLTSPEAPISQLKSYVAFLLSKVNQRFIIKSTGDEDLKPKSRLSSAQKQAEKASSKDPGYNCKYPHRSQAAWIHTQPPPAMTYRPLDTLSKVFEFQFTICEMKKYLIGSLLELNETIYIKRLAQHLVNVSSKRNNLKLPELTVISGYRVKIKLFFIFTQQTFMQGLLCATQSSLCQKEGIC